jgi:hypothetical protein
MSVRFWEPWWGLNIVINVVYLIDVPLQNKEIAM